MHKIEIQMRYKDYLDMCRETGYDVAKIFGMKIITDDKHA